MTVIAARVNKDHIEISCDSQVSRGWHKKNTGFSSKIISGPDFFIGVSGVASIIPLISIYAKNHQIGDGGDERILEWCCEFLEFAKKKTGSWCEKESSILMTHKSGLYYIGSDWVPLIVSDFCAVGSGFEHAESAMYLGHDTRKAVKVAIDMCHGCGGKITTKRIFK